MSELLLSRHALDPAQLSNRCHLGIDQLTAPGCAKPPLILAHTPYLIGCKDADISILNTLSRPPVARGLTELSLNFGSDALLPLAKIRDDLSDAGVGLLSESAVYANRRGSNFVHAVRGYQNALLEYRKAIVANAPNRARISARQTAQRAFDELQRQFRSELRIVTAQIKSRRGTPLTSSERALNIARSSRDITKLHVANQIEANTLVRLITHAKLLVNGLAVINFGARVGTIRNEYRAGGDWHRQMFIESLSFASSASLGSAVASAGSATLIFLIAATPAGWVGLATIGGGIPVAGAAAGAAVGIDNFVQKNADAVYDSLLKEMRF